MLSDRIIIGACQWQEQNLWFIEIDDVYLPCMITLEPGLRLLVTAFLLNTGPISKILVHISHLDTNAWGTLKYLVLFPK